jgi:hypothetical protein
MQKRIYSVRDSKGEIYGQPFFKITHGEAERDFNMLANDPQSTVSRFPEDFDLYYLGDYDDVTGAILALPSPQHVVKAVNLVKRQ